jgi:superkiller protein 3
MAAIPPHLVTGKDEYVTVARKVSRFLAGHKHIRRGICLINAGRLDEAIEQFREAQQLGNGSSTLSGLLASCLNVQGVPATAAPHWNSHLASASNVPASHAPVIRKALGLADEGKHQEAITVLRDAIAINAEDAELHVQLGLLLTTIEDYEEAELRFTQALSIDRDHSEALVNLAMCCGMRKAPGEAISHLQRAQSRRPFDARIGMLLALAMKASRQKGQSPRIQATMPSATELADAESVAELSKIIERDPDFVDAFLSLQLNTVDQEVFAVLLKTLELALERQPEHAELHYHCGRVLLRLGRQDDAISENERAVQLDPKFTRALIELGRLYQATDHTDNALHRLEQAVAQGADYADVHFLLGNLYRKEGRLGMARKAYHRALKINHRFEPAQQALAELLI